MDRWKRTAAVVSVGVTFATAGAVVASLTPAGAAALRDAGNAIVGTLSQHRPQVDAVAGGGADSGFLPPMVITIGPKAHLTSKLTVDVIVSVSCGPFLPASEFGNNLTVLLSEAAGHTVAQGFGFLATLPCDGSTYRLVVTADALNVPFRPGSGLANVSAFACGFNTSVGSVVCESQSAQSFVSIKK